MIFDAQQAILDELTDAMSGIRGLVSVELTYLGKLVVTFLELPERVDSLPSSIKLTSLDGSEQTIPIQYVAGPAVRELLGEIDRDPPLDPTERAGEMGGDQCKNANAMNFYGTIGLYSRNASFQMTGHCSAVCSAAPGLISNNHVIGRSDAGAPGEVIWTPSFSDVARLSCCVPFSCRTGVDLAFAKVNAGMPTQNWTVRQIGVLGSVRRPQVGESIQKFGARTGYTTGQVTSKLNLTVGNYFYRGVFSTTGGFGCPGDSGSAVVATNNDLLGLLSWGETIDCNAGPRGFFWTFVSPGTRSPASTISIELAHERAA